MSSLGALWLPTLVSAIAVFIVSSIIHMVVKWHHSDQSKLPNEDAVSSVLAGTPPGEYRMPWAGSMEEMKSPAFKEKCKKGPMAVIGVWRYEDRGFGKALGQWFVYSVIVAYISGHILHALVPVSPDGHDIFHTVGLTAFLGYGMALAQQSIWGPKQWWPTTKSLIDALLYAATTAAVFWWLWPKA